MVSNSGPKVLSSMRCASAKAPSIPCPALLRQRARLALSRAGCSATVSRAKCFMAPAIVPCMPGFLCAAWCFQSALWCIGCVTGAPVSKRVRSCCRRASSRSGAALCAYRSCCSQLSYVHEILPDYDRYSVAPALAARCTVAEPRRSGAHCIPALNTAGNYTGSTHMFPGSGASVSGRASFVAAESGARGMLWPGCQRLFRPMHRVGVHCDVRAKVRHAREASLLHCVRSAPGIVICRRAGLSRVHVRVLASSCLL